MRIAAPAVAFKAEAIVSPRDLVGYLGAGRHEGKECDLAYHNVLMVLLWSALASGRVALLTHTLRAMPPRPARRGLGHLRALPRRHRLGRSPRRTPGAVGEDGHLHRRFLADFYAGDFPGTFARGARFQPDPRTGEARTSGTAASLAGLEAALEQRRRARRWSSRCAASCCSTRSPSPTAACRSSTWATSSACATTTAWAADPSRREDNRWMHRPPMDWAAAERRADPASVEGRLWAGLRRLVAARRATRAAHAQGAAEPLWTGNDHVFGLLREHAGERLLLLANFTPERQPVGPRRGPRPRLRAQPGGRARRRAPGAAQGDLLVLEPLQYLWLRG